MKSALVMLALALTLGSVRASEKSAFTTSTTVREVVADTAFGDFGSLLFPVDRTVKEGMTLAEVSSSSVYIWYSSIRPETTVRVLNRLREEATPARPIFYRFYTEEEMAQDPEKAKTGFFFFRGKPGAPFAVCNAGGGFQYVGALHDSFPHALWLSEQGVNAFVLIYRPRTPYADLARALAYLHDNAATLGIRPDGYSLWGGSAGARMAASLGNKTTLQRLTGRTDIPQAAAVVMQYTGYGPTSTNDAPTYACVGTADTIASATKMRSRLATLSKLGIPTEFHAYPGLPHGFGVGTGTVAEGWTQDALAFWKAQAPQAFAE